MVGTESSSQPPDGRLTQAGGTTRRDPRGSARGAPLRPQSHRLSSMPTAPCTSLPGWSRAGTCLPLAARMAALRSSVPRHRAMPKCGSTAVQRVQERPPEAVQSLPSRKPHGTTPTWTCGSRRGVDSEPGLCSWCSSLCSSLESTRDEPPTPPYARAGTLDSLKPICVVL